MERLRTKEELREKRPARTPAPGGGLLVGRPFGIELRIDPSWVVIALLVTVSLAGHFARVWQGLPPLAYWAAAGVGAFLFFASILIHELCHSLVARARGATVDRITLFVFGGVSQLRGEPERPRDEFLIAVVGPLASLGLGALFYAGGRLLLPPSLAAAVAAWLGGVNLLLAGFNLLPGYPLDGGRLLRALLWAFTGDLRKATRAAAWAGAAIGGGIIALGGFLIFATAQLLSGVWLALIGWFLFAAARGSVRHLEFRKVLEGYVVGQAMRSDCARAAPGETVEEAVERRILGTGTRCLFVTDDQDLKGLITLHEIRRLPREAWPTSRLDAVMLPLDRLESASPDESLIHALERMEAAGINQLPVLEDGRLLGVIGREDILHVLATALELGEAASSLRRRSAGV